MFPNGLNNFMNPLYYYLLGNFIAWLVFLIDIKINAKECPLDAGEFAFTSLVLFSIGSVIASFLLVYYVFYLILWGITGKKPKHPTDNSFD